MGVLHISLEGDGAWPELQDGRHLVHTTTNDSYVGVTTLEDGTAEGRPSVAIRVDLSGLSVVIEMTYREWRAASIAFEAKYKDREDL